MNLRILTILMFAFAMTNPLGARQLTQAVWVYPQQGAPDPVADPAARQAMIENTSAAGVTDLYVSVYQSNPNKAGRLLYAEPDIADLIRQAHRDRKSTRLNSSHRH